MTESDKKLGRFATILAIMFLVGGLYVFFRDMEYIEKGHTPIILGYCVMCGLFYVCFRSWRVGLSGICVFTMIFLLGFGVQKFNWRKEYVESRTAFFLEEYITEYPSLEQHIMVSYFSGEDWVGFSRNCAEPAMQGQKIPGDCASAELIQKNYGIDVKKVVKDYFGKMKKTAQKIEKGQMKTAKQYQDCVADKSCAIVPMLPKGVDPEEIDPNSGDFIDVRKAFWSVVNDKDVTPEVCEYIKLCKVLVNLKVIDPVKMDL